MGVMATGRWSEPIMLVTDLAGTTSRNILPMPNEASRTPLALKRSNSGSVELVDLQAHDDAAAVGQERHVVDAAASVCSVDEELDQVWRRSASELA